MDVVLRSQEFQGTGHLFREMPHDDLVQASNRGIRILFDHALGLGMVGEVGTLLDEGREIAQLTELHDDVHTGWRFVAVDERHNMWMVEASEDGDFGHEVVFELLVELVHVDRLDGNRRSLLLFGQYVSGCSQHTRR